MPRTAKPSNLKGKTKHGRSKAAVRKAYKKWYAKNKEDIISANVKRNGDRERLKRKGKVKKGQDVHHSGEDGNGKAKAISRRSNRSMGGRLGGKR